MLSETVHTLYHGTIRKGSETIYPCINAYFSVRCVLYDLFHLFNLDRGVPFPALAAYRYVLDLTMNMATFVKAYPADLWQEDSAVINLTPLGKTDAVSPAFSFKHRYALQGHSFRKPYSSDRFHTVSQKAIS